MLNLFEPIGIPLGWIMYTINSVVGNYGITLILFAALVKLCMIPIAIKQQKSMIANARLQPKMREIQKKYANNRTKYAEELNLLYKKEGFSPYTSCLPMAIQFPILFGMLDVIYNPIKHMIRLPADITAKSIEIATSVLGEAGMSSYSKEMSVLSAIKVNPQAFVDGLGSDAANKIAGFDFSMFGLFLGEQPSVSPAGRPMGLYLVLLLIPILSGLTAFWMSAATSKTTEATADGAAASMSKSMLYTMPLMSVWISFVVPAGVGIYWLISNILSAIQTVILNRVMNPAEAAAKAKLEEEEAQERERQERIEQKRLAKERAREQGGKDLPLDEKGLTQKELNRRKLAEARRRDAERYGEEYVDVTDDDVK